MTPAKLAVEQTARDSYGRLLAWLATRCGDLTLAEDALGDALTRALETWPSNGVPASPEAWLLTAARRKVVDRVRRRQTRLRSADALRHARQLRLDATEAVDSPFSRTLPDRRLELMFACAHPHIPPEIRAPLMLQTVLGLDATRIASALLVRPATLAQRLVRAKRDIKARGIAFAIPEAEELPARLAAVLDAIYAAFGTGWAAWPDGEGSELRGLAVEAIWLGQLTVRALPKEPEALGLLALMLLSEARRPARRAADGSFVPIEEQDPTLWDPALLLEGEKALWLAAQQLRGGPYQLEACIQSVHADRARTGLTDWARIEELYGFLVDRYPSTGARVGRAAALGRTGRPTDGLATLDAIPDGIAQRHQPYWAVRAWLLRGLERTDEALEAYARAIGLTEDPAARSWLIAQREQVN